MIEPKAVRNPESFGLCKETQLIIRLCPAIT